MKTIIINEEQYNRILENNSDEEEMIGYHGSPCNDIVQGKFKKGKYGYMGPGIYFGSTVEYARPYARKMGEGTIYTARITMDNPLRLSSRNPTEELLTKIYGKPSVYRKRSEKQSYDTRLITTKDINKFLNMGYDGIIWEWSDYVEYVVYDGRQIELLDKKFIKEEKSNLLLKEENEQNVWYHGGDKNHNLFYHNEIWLIDDPCYAYLYAKDCESPCIFKVVIDENDLQIASIWELDDCHDGEFDPYYDGIDEETRDFLDKEAYDGYSFPLETDNFGGTCLVLKDDSKILSIAPMTDDEFKEIEEEVEEQYE